MTDLTQKIFLKPHHDVLFEAARQYGITLIIPREVNNQEHEFNLRPQREFDEDAQSPLEKWLVQQLMPIVEGQEVVTDKLQVYLVDRNFLVRAETSATEAYRHRTFGTRELMNVSEAMRPARPEQPIR